MKREDNVQHMLFSYLEKHVRIQLLIKDIKVFRIKLIWLGNV